MHIVVTLFFFKQKTAYEMRISDWSSDVCSSDLTWPVRTALGSPVDGVTVVLGSHADEVEAALKPFQTPRLKLVRCARWSVGLRSEERSVGKECVSTCRSWCAPNH